MAMEQSDIKFSIVIPAYNAAGYIENALASCLQQTYPDYEIIVVDDASTDDTATLMAGKYKQQVRYIKLPANLGSAAARNAALDVAAGTHIAFLDADDVWHKDKLQMMKNILQQRPDILLLYHPYVVAGDDSGQYTDNISIEENAIVHKLPFTQLLLRNAMATPCVIMRNETAFRFTTSMRYMEDYDLWLRIGYKHPVYFIGLPLTRIGRPILSKGGLSAAWWKMRCGEIDAYWRLIKLNPLFVLLFPFLLVFSLSKHIRKLVAGI
jgi:teichuronic acid biosynthesis glycosyltransferase TuaG